MLSFKAIIAALAFHAVTGAAAPAESSPDVAALAALAQASIYACEHKNWDGACTNVVVSLNSCCKTTEVPRFVPIPSKTLEES